MGYKVEKAGNGVTTITAAPYMELPKLVAFVRAGAAGCHVISVQLGGDYVLHAEVARGAACANRLAKFMMNGVLSQIGRHRRRRVNKQKRLADEAKGAEDRQ
ncbi:MAG: hypothetical protein II823_06760 [Kiritimatiellae bacterium]|nr:hypothetical protein [Kiritimatiellia bacterium]